MNRIFIFAVVGTFVLITLVSTAPPPPAAPQDETHPVGPEDYDVGVGEEVLAEEATTTARPARRRLPGSRAKAKNGGGELTPRSTTTTTTTEKPAKRTRTGGGGGSGSSSSGGGSRTTTKAPTDVTEQAVSTYRRPKFPPRRLPIPTKKPTTEAPVEELLTEEPLYVDEPAPEGALGPEGQPEPPLEEVVQEGAAR